MSKNSEDDSPKQNKTNEKEKKEKRNSGAGNLREARIIRPWAVRNYIKHLFKSS